MQKIVNIIKKLDLYLVIALVIGTVLRISSLSSNPPGLTPDEASLGYNAYSLLKTGKDEYGSLLPFIFKSFGDYKPGMYIYLSAPFVALFGLTEFAVRLPSAVCGVLIILLIYKILSILFTKRAISRLGAILAAINPWLIYYSRGAWEANLSLFLTLFALYLFLISLNKKPVYLIYSSVAFTLTLFAYQGAKISTAIITFILVLVYVKKVVKFPKKILIGSQLIGFIIGLPILLSLVSNQTGRLEVFSVFNYPRSKEYTEAFLSEGGGEIGDYKYYLFHTETFNFLRGILGRWFNHFSGKFLFFEGDWANPKQSSPNSGMFLHMDLLLFIFGITGLIKSGNTSSKKFIFLWLALSPLPAVLSRDQVQATRSLHLAIPFIFILSVGASQLIEFFSGFKFKKVLLALFAVFYLVNFTYFIDSYFIHNKIHNAGYWYWGYKEVVDKTWHKRDLYNKVLIRQSFDQPYIYFLFYAKYDPSVYQKNAKLIQIGPDVGLVESLENVYFQQLNQGELKGQENILVVGDTVTFSDEELKSSHQFNHVDSIFYPDGVTAFRIVEVNK